MLRRKGQVGTVVEATLPLIGAKQQLEKVESHYEYDTTLVGRRSNLDAAGLKDHP
jgi:hypothetical protein